MKKAINVLKGIGITYKKEDVLVILEKGENALKLIKLIDKAFDGVFIWDKEILELQATDRSRDSYFTCTECNKEYQKLPSLKSHFKAKHEDVEMPESFEPRLREFDEVDNVSALKKHLKDNPRKVLVTQRVFGVNIIMGMKEIRPLQYLTDEELAEI